jgi:hypothetical protein
MSTDDQPLSPKPVPPSAPPVQAGYVPAFNGADGQEDPAPEPVVSSIALPHAAQPATDVQGDESKNDDEDGQDGQDGRFEIAEEVSTDLQTDQARRVGQMPQAADGGGTAKLPDPAAAVTATLTGKKPA